MTDGWTEIDTNFFKAYNMLLTFAGSFILYQPHKGCINDLIDGDLFKKFPVESDNPGFLKAVSLLRTIDPDHPLNYEQVIEDHLELFGGKGKALAPPYTSVYMSADHIMNDRASSEVRKLYYAYGWKSRFEGEIPDDHLGIELQFITLLLDKYPELEDEVCIKEVSKDLIKFIDHYINPWINKWNESIQKNAHSQFYKGIGYLTVSGIEDVYSTIKKIA